jgi:hypothetical protein
MFPSFSERSRRSSEGAHFSNMPWESFSPPLSTTSLYTQMNYKAIEIFFMSAHNIIVSDHKGQNILYERSYRFVSDHKGQNILYERS